MSNIEILSVAKLESRLANTEHLVPQINKNEKEPSWDGHIRIFSDISDRNHDHKKDKLIGKIPVQVKGKEIDSTPLSKNETKYSVEIADLKNYLNDGGVIYFVIEVYQKETEDSDEFDCQIFYNSLTPDRINKILELYGTQKEHTIEFKLFPKNKKQIETIVRNSYETNKRQHSSMGKCISPSLIDLKNDKMHIPLFEYDKSKLVLETLFENGVHAYCIKPDGTELPLFNFNNVTSIEAKSIACVCFSNRSIELESNRLKTQTECTENIGGFLTIHKYSDTWTYEFHESEWYYENLFYTDMLLYLNNTDDKIIVINGIKRKINSDSFERVNIGDVGRFNTKLYSIKKVS